VILAVKVAVAVVVLLLAVATVLRLRKLRRDEMRELSKPTERRLMSPPPSPYAPSKGFRLLDGNGEPLERPAVQRPRLDPDRHYVFSETTSEEVVPSHLRHNQDWFLSRSAHRSPFSTWMPRIVVAALVIAVIVIVATYYAGRHPKTRPSGTGSATTLLSTTTTDSLPASFHPTAASGGDADYTVPLAHYRVVVTAARGVTWVSFVMGAAQTIEWQGDVAAGATEALTLSGDARVTVGSPSNADVAVAGRPVVFPSPLPPTLTLVFSPGSSSAG
jgi:hypothetical protein